MSSACQHAQNLSFLKNKEISAISLRKTEIIIYAEGGVGSCRIFKDQKGNWSQWTYSSSPMTKNLLSMMDQAAVNAMVKEMA